jgi:hypothetical protein
VIAAADLPTVAGQVPDNDRRGQAYLGDGAAVMIRLPINSACRLAGRARRGRRSNALGMK